MTHEFESSIASFNCIIAWLFPTTEKNIINARDVFVMFGAICVAPYRLGDQLLVSNVRPGAPKTETR